MCIINYTILFSISDPVDVDFAKTAYLKAEAYGEMQKSILRLSKRI